MTKKPKTKSSIPRRLKLKPEQIHKTAKSYNRIKEKLQLKKILKDVA